MFLIFELNFLSFFFNNCIKGMEKLIRERERCPTSDDHDSVKKDCLTNFCSVVTCHYGLPTLTLCHLALSLFATCHACSLLFGPFA